MNDEYKHTIKPASSFRHRIKNLSKENRERVLEKVDEICKGLIEGKMLRGKHQGERSLRVGIFRVIYEKPKYCIIIFKDVRNRETAY